MIKRKILIVILLPILMLSFLSVGYSQTVSDTSIISMSGADWSLKVDSVLASSIDSRNTPYMTAKSSTEKELFLELATLEDCKSGVVQFKVDMVGLTAYKQLPLTEQEIAEGSFRPKNVENSFALFDDSGRKVAHIYGSKITDSKGIEVWLDQDLQDGLLTVILPKPEILATLSFPLLLDPTFGYTSVGGTNGVAKDYIYLAGIFSVFEDMNITTVSAYFSQNCQAMVAIYNVTNYLMYNSSSESVTAGAWHNFTIGGVLNMGEYRFSIQINGTGNLACKYDTNTDYYTLYKAFAYADFPNYLDGLSNMGTVLWSIYADYEVYVEPTPTPTPFASATPFPEGAMDDTDWWISILVLLLIIINIFLMMLPFALVRFVFGILSLFLCMLALTYQIPLSPYLQTAGLLISALAMLFSVRARE